MSLTENWAAIVLWMQNEMKCAEVQPENEGGRLVIQHQPAWP